MNESCSRPYCDGEVVSNGLCQTCCSYERLCECPRPVELILWPNKGHPLATSSQVCELTGFSYRMLDYAIRKGGATTTVQKKGSGYARGWSVPDVVRLLETHARSKFPSELNEIEGIKLVIDRNMLTDWVITQWPLDAYFDWDGSLP